MHRTAMKITKLERFVRTKQMQCLYFIKILEPYPWDTQNTQLPHMKIEYAPEDPFIVVAVAEKANFKNIYRYCLKQEYKGLYMGVALNDKRFVRFELKRDSYFIMYDPVNKVYDFSLVEKFETFFECL